MFSLNLYKRGVRIPEIREKCSHLERIAKFCSKNDLYYDRSVCSNRNISRQFLQENPGPCHKSWHYEHPNIFPEDICEIPGGNHYKRLSLNPNLTWKFVEEHIHENWSWGNVCENLKPISDLIENRPDVCDWDAISNNPSLTLEIIENNRDKPFNYDTLSGHPCITWEFVRKHTDRRGYSYIIPWNWYYLCQNPDIFRNIAYLRPFELDWGGLSQNQALTQKFVEMCIDRPWNWNVLSSHPCITWNFVQKHSDSSGVALPEGSTGFAGLPFDYAEMSRNPNMTWKIIKKNIHKRWRWDHLLANPSVINCDNYEEVMGYFTGKSEIFHKQSVWFCRNPNLTYKFFENHWTEWKGLYLYDFLTRNQFLYDPWLYECTVKHKRKLRKYISDFV